MFVDIVCGLLGLSSLVSSIVVSNQTFPTPAEKYSTIGKPERSDPIVKILPPPPVNKLPTQREWLEMMWAEEEEEKDPFDEWVTKNIDDLINKLDTPEFIIRKETYNPEIEDKIIDFIFKQDNVESCETIKEGLIIKTRGGV